MPYRVRIDGLSPATSDLDAADLLSRHGEVPEVSVYRDPRSARPAAFADAVMGRGAREAAAALNGAFVEGRVVTARIAGHIPPGRP